MRRIPTFALALVAGLFVLGVPSALAGGPTSVLLANYESGRSAAALNGSDAYAELQVVLGSERPPAGSTPPADRLLQRGLRSPAARLPPGHRGRARCHG